MREVVRYAGMGRPVIHVTLIKGNAKRYSKKDCLADIRSRRKKILLLRLSEAPGKMGKLFVRPNLEFLKVGVRVWSKE